MYVRLVERRVITRVLFAYRKYSSGNHSSRTRHFSSAVCSLAISSRQWRTITVWAYDLRSSDSMPHSACLGMHCIDEYLPTQFDLMITRQMYLIVNLWLAPVPVNIPYNYNVYNAMERSLTFALGYSVYRSATLLSKNSDER